MSSSECHSSRVIKTTSCESMLSSYWPRLTVLSLQEQKLVAAQPPVQKMKETCRRKRGKIWNKSMYLNNFFNKYIL